MIEPSPLLRVMGVLVVVVGGLLLGSAYVVIGRRRLRRTFVEWRKRSVDRLPAALVVVVVAISTGLLKRVSADVSWLVGWNVTSVIYALEGSFVASIQALAWSPLTSYLAFVYVYGFSFLLIFPFVAYTATPDARPFRETAAAFSLNYVAGLIGYTAFIAFGPRNFIPEQVTSLLYTHWPASHLLTSAMSLNTNVFPSLHTSFAVTVALLAWRTRESFPRWTILASVGAASIVVATMYLGIHWATDVVAGSLVGVVCTAIAIRDPLAGVDRRLRERGAVLLVGLQTRLNRGVGCDESNQP